MSCVCGHEFYEHVELPVFPGGCQECIVGDCNCGQYREYETTEQEQEEDEGTSAAPAAEEEL